MDTSLSLVAILVIAILALLGIFSLLKKTTKLFVKGAIVIISLFVIYMIYNGDIVLGKQSKVFSMSGVEVRN